MKCLSVKAITSRVAALTVTCSIGFVATHVFNRVYVRFERVAMGSVSMESSGRGGFISYRASDGVNLSFDRLNFHSAEDATKAFERALGASTKIILREFVHDREHKFITGERVVALFPGDDGREWPMMVCLDGNNLYEISSSSLRHIFIFEKERRRY